MGLDMYLKLRDSTYAEADETMYPTKKIWELAEKYEGSPAVCTDSDYNLMYWRKANQIHHYFVQHCGDGVDECQDIRVSVQDLVELKDRCIKVMADHTLAKKLLPTSEGFFFGSTDYDEYYYRDLERTYGFLEEFLKEFNPIKDRYTLIYRASW